MAALDITLKTTCAYSPCLAPPYGMLHCFSDHLTFSSSLELNMTLFTLRAGPLHLVGEFKEILKYVSPCITLF